MAQHQINEDYRPKLSRKSFIARLRQFESRLQGNMESVFCPVHLCLGQEEVPALMYENLQDSDWVFSTHRAHGHYLAKGGSEQKLWDEIMGKESGVNGGFSGSQSFSDESVNFHCSAIVGGLVGAATGVAYALKMDREKYQSKAIAVCCVGDAATEAGVFWESVNWAALNRLPIAYICENNEMSVDAHISERQAMPISSRVASFGLSVVSDVGAVFDLARGGSPAFCEVKTELQCDHLNMATMMPTGML